MNISELIHEAHANARDKGWWSKLKTPAEDVALFHSELSEFLEALRDGMSLTEFYYDANGKPIGPASELADVFIRIGDFCGAHGIDLETAIREKLEYNKTRDYRHGKVF